VFARTLFLERRRGNLPKVPSCSECNNGKSQLEHYLATVLPFGGRHDDASDNLQEQVPGRLARNVRLHRDLAEGQETVEQQQAGEGAVAATIALPFNGQRLLNYMEFVVKGLLWHHWRILLSPEHGVRVIAPKNAAASLFLDAFARSARQHVTGDLGNGTVRYQGAQGTDYPELGVWAISLYGGVVLSEESHDHEDQSTMLYAITASNEFLRRPAIIGVFGDGSGSAS